jgi:hypothetical protein
MNYLFEMEDYFNQVIAAWNWETFTMDWDKLKIDWESFFADIPVFEVGDFTHLFSGDLTVIIEKD